MSVHDPRNIILTSKSEEKKLDKEDLILIPKDTGGQTEVRFPVVMCVLAMLQRRG